jgi:hypothetical protein
MNEYNPHREVSIDEAMIGFSGRLGFKQYVPLKPTKRGIKVWVRADPHNGYVGDFQVYTGRTDNTPGINLGGRVVLDLMQPLLHVVQFYRQRARNFLYRAILLFSADRCGITITVGRQN